MPLRRLRRDRATKDPPVLVGDPRLDDWESVLSFEDVPTAVAWRDRLREVGLSAACVADHAPDRFGRGDIYLVVPRDEWSRANEVVENLD